MRGGYTSGINFRVNLEEDLSYEAQLGYRDKGVIFTMIRQQHRPMGMDRMGNWEFIYGFGAHTGFYYTDTYRILFREIYFGREIFTPVIGMNGYLGVEYKLIDLPHEFRSQLPALYGDLPEASLRDQSLGFWIQC